jgi:hypothetical protein
MQASSELPPVVGGPPSRLLSCQEQATEPCSFSDEEFPEGLTEEYDWMLQPASQFKSRRAMRFVVLILAFLFVVFSILMIHKLSVPSRASLVSPSTARY